MEHLYIDEFDPQPTIAIRFFRGVLNFARDAKETLRTTDLNMSEGALRASIAPVEYLGHIPNFPPSEE